VQRLFFGYGSAGELKGILRKHSPKKSLLITGKKSYELCGARDVLESLLRDYNYFIFSDISPNPKLENVEKAVDVFRRERPNFVIAVGGGSVLDVAKAANALSANTGSPSGYVKKEKTLVKGGVPLVAMPTTSGTGSESTQFAVVYIGKQKYSLDHGKFILPDYAIVDPCFTMSLPPDITAETGMDALAQAVESYWSTGSTASSKKYAKISIKMITRNFENSVNRPDRKSRAAMAKASNLAGRAINITRTTACHSISYPITSYFGAPHGQAVGITLPSMMVYNSHVSDADVADKRGPGYVKKTMMELVKLLGEKNPEGAGAKMESMMRNTGLKTRLSELGVKKDSDIELIVKNGFSPERMKNNPRRLTEDSLREMLEGIR